MHASPCDHGRMIRIPALERACNFRDLGGYPARDGRRVRWRRLFRSGVLAQLSAADCATVAGFGVRLVCDLRRPDERATQPNPDFGGGVRQVAWGLPQEGAFLRALPAPETIDLALARRREPPRERLVAGELDRLRDDVLRLLEAPGQAVQQGEPHGLALRERRREALLRERAHGVPVPRAGGLMSSPPPDLLCERRRRARLRRKAKPGLCLARRGTPGRVPLEESSEGIHAEKVPRTRARCSAVPGARPAAAARI